MNILPKKRWHVRTKDNVARVRRDEAKAAEEEKQLRERAALAEQEHRTRMLREKAAVRVEQLFGSRQQRDGDSTKEQPNNMQASITNEITGHVNFFSDLEVEERKNLGTSNPDYEKEKKDDKEEYEKKMGILRYLGEGTSEVPWYQQPRPKAETELKSTTTTSTVQNRQIKHIVGVLPLDQAILEQSKLKRKREMSKISKKKKRRSRSRSRSMNNDKCRKLSDTVQLRAERLKRETEERKRASALIRKSRGEPEIATSHASKIEHSYKQRYNSQFNPETARQNRID